MKDKQRKALSFKEAVASTKDIENCYQLGLKAFGTHSGKINLQNPKKCCGSVDIDGSVAKKYPQDSRWDYAICYNNVVFFVEVHSAYTGEVHAVLKKLQWLKDWLINHAPAINNLKAIYRTPYYWIQSNGNHILPNSPQARQIAAKGLRPISVLQLP
jgi:hypothetical protein